MKVIYFALEKTRIGQSKVQNFAVSAVAVRRTIGVTLLHVFPF